MAKNKKNKVSPLWLSLAALLFIACAAIPYAMVAKARHDRSRKPPVHMFFDMDLQPKLKTQRFSPMFQFGRVMQPPVPGTVARGQLREDDAFYRGVVNGEWVAAIPMEVDMALMKRGQQRFNIYCAPCHGLAGDGDGMVAKRADELAEGTWTPPTSLYSELALGRPVGHLFNTISNGIRNMPAYGSQIPEADRWAIVAYVRALQRSQNSRLRDAPPEEREVLRQTLEQ